LGSSSAPPPAGNAERQPSTIVIHDLGQHIPKSLALSKEAGPRPSRRRSWPSTRSAGRARRARPA
jgi:hypothetical protein